VFFVALVSVLVQGTTLHPFARLLGIEEPEADAAAEPAT
jgi:NhaP-type Na+/H+ and K+/H+ antiporter